ncbi:hypothetical protein PHJA_002427000 [Phtheirospermum japonicum]|uniref:Uncharacterized protein n=1 Tax=Phtheirospermum japonicum TaxID=374723 RepID=A0A830CSK5_9LAMI|nr:hypothetical protein PHJA_002427000 [Phtheirospermum japonicum]
MRWQHCALRKQAMKHGKKRAKASGLRSSADTLRVSNPEEARVMLREDAEIFDSIGRSDSAAECFCDLGKYERAACNILSNGKPKSDLYTRTAERVGGNSPWKKLIENVNGIMEFRYSIRRVFLCKMTIQIKASRIDFKYYFSVLMLRLIMILCSLCLNSFTPFNVLYQALDVPQIWSQLHREFCQALWRRKNNHNSSYMALIASAFKVIGDPLVIVSSTGVRPKFVSTDAIFVDLRPFSCKNEVVICCKKRDRV